jgi:hypothetical protein
MNSVRVRDQGVLFSSVVVLVVVLVGVPGSALADDIPLAIYGDIDAIYKNDNANSESFSSPRIELFYSNNWGKLSFLTEIMFEADEDNRYVLDVERVQLAYVFAEWLRMAAGRFHTAIGYYNDAYHHGYYFVLPTERPTAVDFEDAGGLIPAHSVGVHFDGRVRLSTSVVFRYDTDVANGRGAPGEVTIAFARKQMKALNLRLRLELGTTLDGVVFGGNLYTDEIPANAGDPVTGADRIPFAMREIIAGAHVAYLGRQFHLISEYSWIQHSEKEGRQNSYSTQYAFGELGYTLEGAWTPYARYEYTRFGSNPDPFYAFNAAARGSYHRGTLGLNYLASEYLVLKVEASIQHFGDAVAAGARQVYTIASQCAYAF